VRIRQIPATPDRVRLAILAQQNAASDRNVNA